MSWALALGAALCAVLMGAAIQRGATCTVAAVSEIVEQRQATRLRSLLEASCWIAAGLLWLRAWIMPIPMLPSPQVLTGWTLAGAVLLGLGAFVNQACVFGAIARLGNGEWRYLATPLGFYLGCLSVGWLFPTAQPQALPPGSPLWNAPHAVGWGLAALAFWRVASAWRRRPPESPWWTPHVATVCIGLSFLALLWLQGAWAYTDALAELARSGMAGHAGRLVLFVCLLAGAMAGGWQAGLWRLRGVRAAELLRCLAGGVMMGWGSLLIPGSNDGLILLGLPLLWPHAWVAFAAMIVVIALALNVQRIARARFTIDASATSKAAR